MRALSRFGQPHAGRQGDMYTMLGTKPRPSIAKTEPVLSHGVVSPNDKYIFLKRQLL